MYNIRSFSACVREFCYELWKVLKTFNCTILEMQTRLRFRTACIEILKHDINMFELVIVCRMKTSG